ncbi:MAG: alpha/beta-hydrolase family protein [Actinomycetes bacterium]
MSVLGQVLGKLGPGLDPPARAGLLAAAASIGPSLQRGMMPRSTLNQAMITGTVSAASFGLTTSTQSVIQSLALAVAGDSTDRGTRGRRRGLVLAMNAVAAGVGYGVQRALPQQANEPVLRATLRTSGDKLVQSAVMGSVVMGGIELFSRVDSSRDDDVFEKVPFAIPLGVGLAALYIWRQRRTLAEAGADDAFGQPVESAASATARKSILAGTGVTVALVGLAQGERALAGLVAGGVSAATPGLAPYGRLLGHLTAFGLLGFGAKKGLDAVYEKSEQGGEAVEAAYRNPPTSACVSGGPKSLVDWATIGREGRRFVNMALTRDEIVQTMGSATHDPIRAFVGLETVPQHRPADADVAADLAIRELEALGAFERSVLCFFSPTGTGYVNYVAVETLEHLTRGNCASVSIQYSVRPSFLSLDRTALGEAQVRAFLNALRWRMSTIPEDERPRVVLFGESLGSWTAQDAFLGHGISGYERLGVERALFIGTPWESRWHRALQANPDLVDPAQQVVTVSDPQAWEALPEAQREAARVVLLTNENDPIATFSPQLLVQCPPWMGPPETRPTGVPRETQWRSPATFMITVSDLLNALNPIPGVFVAAGHDYRESLGRMTQQAFRLPATDDEMARVEDALRARELQFAQRRLIDETLAKGEEKIKEQLGKWGLDTSQAPPLVAAPTS